MKEIMLLGIPVKCEVELLTDELIGRFRCAVKELEREGISVARGVILPGGVWAYPDKELFLDPRLRR
jgi:hypothetical protein